MNDAPSNPNPPVKKLALPMILLIVFAMVLSLLIISAVIRWMPSQSSTYAWFTDALYYYIYWISVFFTLLIAGTLVFFLMYYRQTDKAAAAPGKVTHSTALELTWTIIPVFIVLSIFAFGFKGYMNMAVAPSNSYEIVVFASQWSWQFQYPNGYTDSHLHIPADQPVKLIMQSNDVIHSVFIRQFRAKKDVVPGRYNTMWFESSWDDAIYDKDLAVAKKLDESDAKLLERDRATYEQLRANLAAAGTEDTRAKAQAALDAFPHINKEGAFAWSRPDPTTPRTTDFKTPVMTFDLYCTEYCGTSHSQMNRKVFVHRTRAEFDAWLADASDVVKRFPNPADLGRQIWQNQCATCHSIDGKAGTGPSWLNLFGSEREFVQGPSVIADENYIRESILNPQAKIVQGYQGQNMASFQGQLDDKKIHGLVQFIKQLSDGYNPEGWGEYAEGAEADQNNAGDASGATSGGGVGVVE